MKYPKWNGRPMLFWAKYDCLPAIVTDETISQWNVYKEEWDEQELSFGSHFYLEGVKFDGRSIQRQIKAAMSGGFDFIGYL